MNCVGRPNGVCVAAATDSNRWWRSVDKTRRSVWNNWESAGSSPVYVRRLVWVPVDYFFGRMSVVDDPPTPLGLIRVPKTYEKRMSYEKRANTKR